MIALTLLTVCIWHARHDAQHGVQDWGAFLHELYVAVRGGPFEGGVGVATVWSLPGVAHCTAAFLHGRSGRVLVPGAGGLQELLGGTKHVASVC